MEPFLLYFVYVRYRGFNPSKVKAHPKVLLYYSSIDSTFPHATKGVGEDDLKSFIEQRKNRVKYQQDVVKLSM